MANTCQSPTPRFAFYTQAQVFENISKSAEKRHMRIGGPIGSECEDIAKEVVLQKGLNYEDFLGLRGFFNKNHSADTLDILGAPETVRLYEAGEAMPDGRIAKHATTWVEGFLYDTAKGRETYELAKAMQGSGRSLGFSIEGHVEERSGPGNRTISKARIQNVAITHVPCNPDARLEILLRSVAGAQVPAADMKKTLSVGGGPLLVAQEGHEVPVEDARPSGKKPTGLPLTLEELDRRIVSVTHPLIQTLVVAKKTSVSGPPRASFERRQSASYGPSEATGPIIDRLEKRRAAAAIEQMVPPGDGHLDFYLRKAAAAATAQVAEMAAAISAPVAAKTAPPRQLAKKSPSNARLLQSIFKAMPGVSVSYAQGLAETIRRNRARS